MITADSFKLRFGNFACYTDEKIQVFIDEAVLILNEIWWGDKYNLGLNYLTAHLLSLSVKEESASNKAVATSGPISSKSVDGVSVSFSSYSPQDEDDAFYMSTTYGQRYLQLRGSLGIPAYTV
jgi:hypothetical protein